VVFYSDKASIFRIASPSHSKRSAVTQFGRALSELNIDILCANTPQAKGRVERAHLTLQDRLVKELRLRNLSTPEAANAFLPEFLADYNTRFACDPSNAHDTHRPVRDDEDLDVIFTWQKERKLSSNLTLHYKRVIYLVEPRPETLALVGRRCRVHEHEDGRVEVRHAGKRLPCRVFFDKDPCVQQGAIVANKRLGAVLSKIRVDQQERDRQRLARRALTLRQKDRIRTAAARANASNAV